MDKAQERLSRAETQEDVVDAMEALLPKAECERAEWATLGMVNY